MWHVHHETGTWLFQAEKAYLISHPPKLAPFFYAATGHPPLVKRRRGDLYLYMPFLSSLFSAWSPAELALPITTRSSSK